MEAGDFRNVRSEFSRPSIQLSCFGGVGVTQLASSRITYPGRCDKSNRISRYSLLSFEGNYQLGSSTRNLTVATSLQLVCCIVQMRKALCEFCAGRPTCSAFVAYSNVNLGKCQYRLVPLEFGSAGQFRNVATCQMRAESYHRLHVTTWYEVCTERTRAPIPAHRIRF